MSPEKRKRNPFLYVLLGLMIISLLGFTIFPVGISFFDNNNLLNKPASATNTSDSDRPQDELELQAKGYQLVLDREPDNQTALRGLIDVRLQQGNIAATLEPLASLADLNPDTIDYGILLAQTQQQVGQYENAVSTYRNILDNHPESILALQGIANLFLDREVPDKAISLLKDSIANAKEINLAKPDSIDIIGIELLLGQVYAFSEDYDRAISSYDSAIELDENDFRPVVSKALILQQQGDLEAAKSLFTKAVSLAPEYKNQIEKMAGEAIEIEPETTAKEDSEETVKETNSEPPDLEAVKEEN
ncbi:MAG: tetratricopeptide repeat protein [Prochloraceae cyanobacterium]